MTYDEALHWIHSGKRLARRPGLQRMRKLMSLLGDPQKELKFFHVAGTNGKGSTCAMLTSCLSRAGYRTGLYISPFIIDFRERMQINGEMISKKELCQITETVKQAVDTLCAQGEEFPSEFEVVTAIAFCWYQKCRCDYVVLEVGLGGRLDPTNVIDNSVVSVICTIDYDHTELLGETIEQIATEKCGILKQNGLTVYSPQSPQAEKTIQTVAQKEKNRAVCPNLNALKILKENLDGTVLEYEGIHLELPLLGKHQHTNCITALTALLQARKAGRLRIENASIQEGIAGVHFPARLEKMGEAPIILLDGAHNPNGTQALAESVKQYFAGKKCVGIVGMLRDKDYKTALQNVIPCFSHVLTVQPDSPRALSAQELAQTIQKMGVSVQSCKTAKDAIQAGTALAGEDGVLVVFGSLFLASGIRKDLLSDEK